MRIPGRFTVRHDDSKIRGLVICKYFQHMKKLCFCLRNISSFYFSILHILGGGGGSDLSYSSRNGEFIYHL